jgi:hypothetical protein
MVKDTGISGIRVRRAEGGNIKESRRGSQVERWQMGEHSVVHAWVMLPQIRGKLTPRRTNNVKVRGGGVVTKHSTCINHTIVSLNKCVHCHAVGMVAHEPKGSTDVIVGNVDL